MAEGQLLEVLKEAFTLFDEANIVRPKEASIHIYHHNGVENFKKTGAVFINVVNRDYCKSYIIMLQGQNYPGHYHKIKTESFYMLYGSLEVEVDGESRLLKPGDMMHVERGQDHSFWTRTGAVFEEISTMYVPNDSMYLDREVRNRKYDQRRTSVKINEWEEISRKWKR